MAVIILGVVLWAQRGQPPAPAGLEDAAGRSESDPGQPQTLPQASSQNFSQRDDGKMVVVTGVVDRILSDDRDGSRHQRFILRASSGQTLLVAHNIDLAPRLDGLSTGETLTLYGQYESNDRGGVVHWTHRDPQGIHPGGYIDRQGRRYE